MPYMMTLLESTGFSLDSVLESAKSIFTWVYGIVTENALLSIAFTLAIIVPVAVKSFKKISKAGN